MKLLRALKAFFYQQCSSISMRYRGFKDYYIFPFDVSTPLNEHAEYTLKEACSLLESIKVNYYLCDGTILGIIRDERLIPHDNDIDVSVLGAVDLGVLKKTFINSGYTVGREVFYQGSIQQLIFYSKHQVIFDICFWHDENKQDNYYYHYVPEVKKGRRQKRCYFDSVDYIAFRGKQYPTHGNIKEWLREHFGDDWTIPAKSKGDWREEIRDIIK